MSFSGKELRNVYGFPPTVGKMSICIATFEYNGQVAMGILMDDNVPEYELFGTFMHVRARVVVVCVYVCVVRARACV